MKSLIIIFGAMLLIIATPFVFTAITDAITQEYTQTISGIVTGDLYAANATLGRAIYNNDTSSVVSIASNHTADSPTASAYNLTTRALEVSGLSANTTRSLTVVYDITSTIIPGGSALVIGLLRWFWVFVIIGLCGGAIYAFFD